MIRPRLVGPRIATWSPGAEPPGLEGGADGAGLVVELAPRDERRLARRPSPRPPRSGSPVGASAASSSRSIVDAGRAIRVTTLVAPHPRPRPSECLRAGPPAPDTRMRRDTRMGSHRGARGWARRLGDPLCPPMPRPPSSPAPRGRRRRSRPPLHGRARPGDRARWQERWDVERHVRGAEPGRPAGRSRRRRRAGPQAVRARHVPVPVGHRPARRPPARLHRHRRLQPLPADGRAQRPVHDGLRRLRPARRAVRRADRHPPGDHDGRRTSPPTASRSAASA